MKQIKLRLLCSSLLGIIGTIQIYFEGYTNVFVHFFILSLLFFVLFSFISYLPYLINHVFNIYYKIFYTKTKKDFHDFIIKNGFEYNNDEFIKIIKRKIVLEKKNNLVVIVVYYFNYNSNINNEVFEKYNYLSNKYKHNKLLFHLDAVSFQYYFSKSDFNKILCLYHLILHR